MNLNRVWQHFEIKSWKGKNLEAYWHSVNNNVTYWNFGNFGKFGSAHYVAENDFDLKSLLI